MACSSGASARLAVVEDGVFDADALPIPFLYENIQKQGRIIGTRAISGTREQRTQQTRIGSYQVAGRFSFNASPLVLDALLPWILGADEAATDTFKTAEDLQEFDILVDRVGGVFQYTDCKVNRAIFRAQGGPGDSEEEFLECIIEVIGKTENEAATWGGTIPAYSIAATSLPYLLSDATGAITINSNVTEVKNFVLVIDNHLEPRWVNSLTPTEICPQDRTIMLRIENPYTTVSDPQLYNLAAAKTGVTGSLVFTNTPAVLTFTFVGLQWADQSPNVIGKQSIPLFVDFIARSKGAAANDALIITNKLT